MNIRAFFRTVLVIGALFSGLTPTAQAATYNYHGDTTDGPTYQRPLATLASLSTTGTDVNYQTFSFTVSEIGEYAFVMFADFDGMLFLYRDPFDPSQPLLNALAGSDDLLTPSVSGFAYDVGDTGAIYTLVATSFENGVTGPYSLTINGPGLVSAVPEPATWLMLGLGLVAVGWVGQRQRQR